MLTHTHTHTPSPLPRPSSVRSSSSLPALAHPEHALPALTHWLLGLDSPHMCHLPSLPTRAPRWMPLPCPSLITWGSAAHGWASPCLAPRLPTVTCWLLLSLRPPAQCTPPCFQEACPASPPACVCLQAPRAAEAPGETDRRPQPQIQPQLGESTQQEVRFPPQGRLLSALPAEVPSPLQPPTHPATRRATESVLPQVTSASCWGRGPDRDCRGLALSYPRS